jgi:hypothetical protein
MKPAKPEVFVASSNGEALADHQSKNVENFRLLERKAIDRWENEGGEIPKLHSLQELCGRTAQS